MRRDWSHMKLKIIGTVSVVMVLTACSSQPTKPAAEKAPASAAAVAQPAAAPATAAQAASTDGKGPQVNRTLVSAGYKPTTIKGEVYYCRTVDVTNTAFKKKVCLNESQIKDEERRIKDMQQEMMRSRTNPGCSGPGCG